MKYSDVISTIKNYRWRSLFIRYWLIIFIPLLIIFFIFTYIISQSYDKALKTETNAYASQALYKIENSMNGILDSINNYYLDICVDANAKIFFLINSVDEANTRTNILELRTSMQNFLKSSNIVDSIYVYSRENNYVLSTSSYFNSNDYSKFIDNGWYDYYESNDNSVFIRTIKTRDKQQTYISVCQNVADGKNILGAIVFNLNYSELKKLCKSDDDNKNHVYLTNKNDEIILSDIEEEIGKNIYEISDLANHRTENISSTETDDGEISIFLKTNNPNYNNQRAGNINKIFLLAIALIFVALIISLLLTVRFYDSIAHIITILQNPFQDDEQHKRFDEFNFINKKIMSILNKNSEIEVELAKRISMLKRSQAITLQAQLNPHFLFNTLHLINSIEMMEHKADTDVTRAISLLSEILRKALDTTELFVKLHEEIQFLEKYFEIENLKYKDKFRVIWDIDENTKNLKVLKLLLQPIVENALSHGIAPMDGNGIITIKSEIKENSLHIEISDNGIGMTEQELLRVRAKINSNILEKSSNLGLANTNQRIQLIFGENYSCKIDSSKKGTRVIVNLPVIDNCV